VALASTLYRRDQGGPPPTLASLVPRWLPAPPRDPFLGTQPLRHAPGRLWSVYLNGHDDHGRSGEDADLALLP